MRVNLIGMSLLPDKNHASIFELLLIGCALLLLVKLAVPSLLDGYKSDLPGKPEAAEPYTMADTGAGAVHPHKNSIQHGDKDKENTYDYYEAHAVPEASAPEDDTLVFQSVPDPEFHLARLIDDLSDPIDNMMDPDSEREPGQGTYEADTGGVKEPQSQPQPELEPAIEYERPEAIEKPQIAIIIDDMGMSYQYTDAVVDMDGPLTLAFLPYAPRLEETTKRALSHGHELMIHVPMEPMDGSLDIGPIGLKNDMDRETFLDIFNNQVLTSFDGYVGINNHMGSRLTQNEESMGWLMDVLQDKGLYFIDSKTISTSVAADTARRHGVTYAERDVFLDHYNDLDRIRKSLRATERVALAKGRAIAIGHPRKHTVTALREWLPTLKAKGFELVPASALTLKRKQSLVKKESEHHTIAAVLSNISPAAGEGAYPEDLPHKKTQKGSVKKKADGAGETPAIIPLADGAAASPSKASSDFIANILGFEPQEQGGMDIQRDSDASKF